MTKKESERLVRIVADRLLAIGAGDRIKKIISADIRAWADRVRARRKTKL